LEGLFILFAYTVVILFLTIDDRANGSRQYNTGGGKLSPLSGSLSIAAAWIWAPAFFVSSERGYLYGWQGLTWFIVPNVLCLLLFAPFADKVRRIFPAGVTLSGFMEMRYKSRAVGNVYRFQLGALAVFSTGVQLLAGGKVLSAVTDIPFFGMTVILSMIAFSYSQRAGIIASVKTNAVQMILMLFVAVLALAFTFTLEIPGTTLDGLAGVSSVDAWELALAFGIPNAIGLLSGPFGDQSFWQRAFSIERKSVFKAFVFGAMLFAIVPLSMGIIGIAAAGGGYAASDAAFVNLEFIRAFFPPWFMALFLVMILSGLLSTVDCNLCSVASMASDFRGDLKTAKVSMLVLLALGIAVANIPGITVTGLFLFYGTLRASTLFVTLLTLSGKRLAARGVFYGVVLSVIVGLPVFAFGSVADIPEIKVLGSVLSVGISGAFAIIYTKGVGRNEDYESKY
jgi:Na+/proline symporter